MKIPRVPKIIWIPWAGRSPLSLYFGMAGAFIVAAILAIHFYDWRQELRPPPPDPDVLARREIATRIEGAEFEITKVRRPHVTTDVPGGDRDYWYEALNSYEYVVSCWTPATVKAGARPADDLPPGSVFAGQIRHREVGRYPQPDELTKASLTAIDALRPGPGWIAWQHAAFRISFDRCLTWIEFEPWRHLPPPQVLLYDDRRCDTEHCALITLRESGVSFSDLEVSRDTGAPRLSFVMTSPGLANPAGVAVSSDDGGKTWRIVQREASIVAVAPVATPPVATPPVAQPSPRETRRLRALSDEELQAIPIPAVRGDRTLLIGKIREAARRGSIEGVKRAWIKDVVTKPGDDMEIYREAVLASWTPRRRRSSPTYGRQRNPETNLA